MRLNNNNLIIGLAGKTIAGLNFLAPLFDLGLRLWVARIFWNSGRQKTASWDSTLMLFEYEYAVPLIPFDIAAYLATGAELAAPVLLVLGLGSRAGALALFILNYVAVISYPDINIAGIKDHMLWGTILAVTFFHGPGKISIDHFIKRKLASGD
jgi:putative oxidoreductase